MKVLDLRCALGHTFEGWFASEEDFVSQCEHSQVECPLCGDQTITKKLSAPRLSLAGKQVQSEPKQEVSLTNQESEAKATGAWLALARAVIANTTDVGDRFAQEARKMHYGETEERSIRGQATSQETQALLDEGIGVMPLVLPDFLKEPLQ